MRRRKGSLARETVSRVTQCTPRDILKSAWIRRALSFREEVMAKVRVIEQERGLIYIPNFNNRILLIFLENTRCHRDDCKFYLIVRLIYTVDSGQPGAYT